MREIEVKAKISDFSVIIKQLEDLGCKFTDPIIQKDRIFLEKGLGFKDIKPGIRVLRIRGENNKTILNLKIHVKDELDCIEKEIIVNDSKEMLEIIEKIGYHEVARVNKKRIKCNYHDYEICLDEVENLGVFIEVEKKSDKDVEKVRDGIMVFLRQFGVKEGDRVFFGYDTLLFNEGKELTSS